MGILKSLKSILPGLLLAGCSSTPEVLTGPVPAPPNQGFAVTPSFDYRIGPGDILRINVFRHPELSSAFFKASTPGTPVDGNGTIALPFLDPIPVNGDSVFQVRDKVAQGLSEYMVNPKVDVAVIEFHAHRVYVVGEVKNPGMFVLDRSITAQQALALAGGFTNFSYRDEIALIRGPVKPENVTLFNADEVDPRSSMVLQADDIIFVGRRAFSGVGQAFQDLVPILQVISLPISTARDVAIFNDVRGRR